MQPKDLHLVLCENTEDCKAYDVYCSEGKEHLGVVWRLPYSTHWYWVDFDGNSGGPLSSQEFALTELLLVRSTDQLQTWIPTTKRLPEVDKTKESYGRSRLVLLLTDETERVWIGRLHLIDGKTYWSRRCSPTSTFSLAGDFFDVENVTHWLPIPPLPKREGNKRQ